MSRLIKSTSSSSRVYVGNLPIDVIKDDIEDIFYKVGHIVAVDIHNRFDPAFAFVEFEDPRDAEDAIYEKHNRYARIAGKEYRLKVEYPKSEREGSSRDDRISSGRGRYVPGRGRSAPIRRSENRVLVTGLPPTGSWQDLKDHMREAGTILYADVYKDGTGIIEFEKRECMEWAVKNLDDTKFRSHENETSYIQVKRDGNGSGSRSPSRSRSRSRSNYRSRSRSRSRTRSRSRSRSRSPHSRRRSYTRSRSRSGSRR